MKLVEFFFCSLSLYLINEITAFDCKWNPQTDLSYKLLQKQAINIYSLLAFVGIYLVIISESIVSRVAVGFENKVLSDG